MMWFFSLFLENITGKIIANERIVVRNYEDIFPSLPGTISVTILASKTFSKFAKKNLSCHWMGSFFFCWFKEISWLCHGRKWFLIKFSWTFKKTIPTKWCVFSHSLFFRFLSYDMVPVTKVKIFLNIPLIFLRRLLICRVIHSAHRNLKKKKGIESFHWQCFLHKQVGNMVRTKKIFRIWSFVSKSKCKFVWSSKAQHLFFFSGSKREQTPPILPSRFNPCVF